jgi:hypothetical protein
MRSLPPLRSPLLLALTGSIVLACGADGSSSDDGVEGGRQGEASGADRDADRPDPRVLGPSDVPPFRNPVDVPDADLGRAVLALMGAPVEGSVENCNRCHGLTRESLRDWLALGNQALAKCLVGSAVTDRIKARGMIDCLRIQPSDPDSDFSPAKLGVYTTAAHLSWFAYLFELAYGDGAPAAYQLFRDRVAMPRGDLPLMDQPRFDLVAEYFARGLPLLDELLPGEPDPGGCTVEVTGAVATHVAEMALSGWRAVNRDSGILMHGCGGAGSPRECLATSPRVPEWESLASTAVRRLGSVPYSSAFWTRSSADGRFVAHGRTSGTLRSAFVDLQTSRVIPARAFYDPGFFPDNSGFAFQSSRALFCPHEVLSAGPLQVNFTEPGCTSNQQVGLYQHLGAALGGGDYWVVDSQFVSDNGGNSPTLSDPRAPFSADATSSLTPMIHQGNRFLPGTSVAVETPLEGDSVLSPSARLLITRVAGEEDRQLGFMLRRVDATATPGGYEVLVPEVARYCVNGGKPGFSFDERWITYHHYVQDEDAVDLGFTGPDDPGFAPYRTRGAANVYVMDLLVGEGRRVTRMRPGEYALFPHFRSDGWIYFMVRPPGPGEIIAATDAALVLAGE